MERKIQGIQSPKGIQYTQSTQCIQMVQKAIRDVELMRIPGEEKKGYVLGLIAENGWDSEISIENWSDIIDGFVAFWNLSKRSRCFGLLKCP